MEGDKGIMILAEVQPASYLGSGVGCKGPPIKAPYEVLRSTSSEGSPGVDIDQHDPLTYPRVLHRELEEVWALKLTGTSSISIAEGTDILPLP